MADRPTWWPRPTVLSNPGKLREQIQADRPRLESWADGFEVGAEALVKALIAEYERLGRDSWEQDDMITFRQMAEWLKREVSDGTI